MSAATVQISATSIDTINQLANNHETEHSWLYAPWLLCWSPDFLLNEQLKTTLTGFFVAKKFLENNPWLCFVKLTRRFVASRSWVWFFLYVVFFCDY